MKRDKQEGPDIGAFLLASVLHFYSGRPLQNLSGVDTHAYVSIARDFLQDYLTLRHMALVQVYWEKR